MSNGKRIVDGLKEAKADLDQPAIPNSDGKYVRYARDDIPEWSPSDAKGGFSDEQVQAAAAWALAVSQITLPKGSIVYGDVFCLPDGTRFKVVVLPKA